MPDSDLDRVAFMKWSRSSSDSTPASVLAEVPIGQPGSKVVADGNIVAATITASADVVGDATNNATIVVSKRTAGGAPVTIATLTSTTTWKAGIPVAMTLVGGAPVSAGDLLTVQATKGGTGVTLPGLALEVQPSPNWVDVMLAGWSDKINARLRKRYAIPQVAPYPETILSWLTRLGTRDAYAKRGWNPLSEQDQTSIEAAAVQADKETIEAADSEKGLIDLPLRSDVQGASGIKSGMILSYSEQSPYTAFDLQRVAGRQEDSNG